MKALKRKYPGYYELVVGSIRASIVKTSSNGWESCLEVFSHNAKDFEGTPVKMYDVIGENAFSRTKKDAYDALEYKIKNEL